MACLDTDLIIVHKSKRLGQETANLWSTNATIPALRKQYKVSLLRESLLQWKPDQPFTSYNYKNEILEL